MAVLNRVTLGEVVAATKTTAHKEDVVRAARVLGLVGFTLDPYAEDFRPKAEFDAKRVLTAEQHLVLYTVSTLMDPKVNPLGGSLSLERLEYLVRDRKPNLYTELVKETKQRRWTSFLYRHPEIFFVFHYRKSPYTNKRVRLYWYDGRDVMHHDDVTRRTKTVALRRFVDLLTAFLGRRAQERGGDECTLDAFLTETHLGLRRGDAARLLRTSVVSQFVTFDDHSYTLRLVHHP